MTQEAMRAVIDRIQSDRAFGYQLYLSPHEALAAYDLTRDEKMHLMLPNFSWIIPDRLAGSARPLHPEAIEAFPARGVAAVVSLTEEPLPADLVSRAGLECTHLPVADFTAPAIDQIEAAVMAIDGYLETGRPVAVHCAGGLGRTGTILACYLVRHGSGAANAIGTIRAQRPGSIETPEQEAVIAMYERHLAKPAGTETI
ncbi:MAG: dual specificity protein phosphatase 23 [Dehalococcoidia bacterium]